MMSKEARFLRAKVRLHMLKENGKNIDSPGVIHKLERKIKRFEANKGE